MAGPSYPPLSSCTDFSPAEEEESLDLGSRPPAGDRQLRSREGPAGAVITGAKGSDWGTTEPAEGGAAAETLIFFMQAEKAKNEPRMLIFVYSTTLLGQV